MQSTEALQIGHFLRNEVANFSFSGGNFASTRWVLTQGGYMTENKSEYGKAKVEGGECAYKPTPPCV